MFISWCLERVGEERQERKKEKEEKKEGGKERVLDKREIERQREGVVVGKMASKD